MVNIDNILKCFPEKLKREINMLSDNNKGINYLEEIRLRVNKNVILKLSNSEIILDYIINKEEILEVLSNICDNSIYTYQEQICNGFITIKGGHRVGLTGSTIIKDGKVVNITNISSLNFRIAKQVIDCSKKVLEFVINYDDNLVYNTLIVSSPGVRKNYTSS